MIQALDPQQTVIATIVSSLVSEFHPECIYLFGSRARRDHHDDSDYDFYMEVAPANWPQDQYLTRNGIFIHLDFQRTEVHVRVPGWLEKKKDEPGCVMYDVAREGILLYAVAGIERVVPASVPRLVRERRRISSRKQEEWLRHAQLDFDLVIHLSTDIERWKEPIAFHSQQAAEKFLKALIASHETPPHTHDLQSLLYIARAMGSSLGGIDRRCRRLIPYAVEARYPNDEGPAFPSIATISLDNARFAIEDMRAIREAVERELA